MAGRSLNRIAGWFHNENRSRLIPVTVLKKYCCFTNNTTIKRYSWSFRIAPGFAYELIAPLFLVLTSEGAYSGRFAGGLKIVSFELDPVMHVDCFVFGVYLTDFDLIRIVKTNIFIENNKISCG